MKKLFFVVLVAITAAVVGPLHAQTAPNGQFGVGLTTSVGLTSLGLRMDYLPSVELMFGSGSSAQFTYAINTNVHVGARLRFASHSQSEKSMSLSSFAPFFRYLFSASGGVMPYLLGEYNYTSVNVNVSSGGLSGSSTESLTALYLGGGVAHYWNATFGVRGEIFLLNLGLTPSYTQFAIVPVRVGIDWFFGR